MGSGGGVQRRGAAASRAASSRVIMSSGGRDAVRTGACGVSVCPRWVRVQSVDEGGGLGYVGSKGEALDDHVDGGVAKCHGLTVCMHKGGVQRGQ